MTSKKTTTPMSDAAIKALVARSVADALAEHETNRSRNGDDSHDSGSGGRRQVITACEINSVFHISNCTVENQGKLSTCALIGVALTWWNSHVKTVGNDAAYGMPWKTLMKMMIDKYRPRSEIKKLDIEIWNLKVKGTDVVTYTQRFRELALMCRRMFPEESDQVEKYVGGLLDMIQGSRQAESKRKFDNNNQAQQQPPKKQSVAIAHTAGSGERREYAGTLPLYNRCKLHHNGPCTIKCGNCKKNQRTLTFFECGNQGHYMSEGTKVRGMVYALGRGETNQDIDDMEDDINA
nr:hypothetical protein [Tanacetum cinerariifolium]